MGILIASNSSKTSALSFQNFLLGVAFIGCYLNSWSLFLPANWYALIPLLILAVFTLKHLSAISEISRYFSSPSFSKGVGVIAISLLAVILIYSLLTPQHGDSPGYHFLTIRWSEEYKAVPGLANLHGRLGFNSSFFVTSAAFAFSRLVGQPLYVLNIIFAFCYYLWLIHKIYIYRNNLWSIVYLFLAIAMLRHLLDSISSPTPDVLASIIISYVFIAVTENLLTKDAIDKDEKVVLLLLIFFAFTVKLNTLPLGLIGLFLLFTKSLLKRRKALWIIIGGGMLVLVPWIIRNYILTGYLIFPVSATGFLHPDWQVSSKILHFEKLLINNGPKLISQRWEEVNALSFFQWFPLWIKAHLAQGLIVSLVILVVAIICAVASVVIIQRRRHTSLFLLAVINMISIFFWMYNSPDYRFGYPYLLNAIVLLALFATRNKPATPTIKYAAVTLVVILCGYYIKKGVALLSSHSVASYVIKPLRALQYDPAKKDQNFPFMMLNKNVKLYVEDRDHWCNMAALPCMIPYNDSVSTGQIQLRGDRLEDGFRMNDK